MLESWCRLTLLYFLCMVYQLSSKERIKIPRILKFERKDIKNILPLYLDLISRLSDQSYVVVISDPSVRNVPEKYIEPVLTRNFRRGGFVHNSDLTLKRYERRKERDAHHYKSNWTAEHQLRLNYINSTLINRYRPTLYLYYEMRRIQRDRRVLDRLRRMVLHLEQPGNEHMQHAVMECYNKTKPPRIKDAWEIFPTNNLVKNIMQDPINDNVLN